MAAAGDIAQSEFKILAEKKYPGFPFVVSTALYPEWPLAKLEKTPSDVADRVVKTLLNMPADDPAAKAARIVGWTEPMDYQVVENLQQLLQVGAYQ
jgi:ABC-type phosphate/phosphonate transport system substrate-binding protein